MSETVIKGGPGELLASVPHLMGFQPEDSLLIMIASPDPNRFAGRIDMPTTLDEIDECITGFQAPLSRLSPGCTAFIATYSDNHDLSLAVLSALSVAITEAGHIPAGGVRAHDGQWYWTLREDPTPNPIPVTDFVAARVLDGSSPFQTREEMQASLEPGDTLGVVEAMLATADTLDPSECFDYGQRVYDVLQECVTEDRLLTDEELAFMACIFALDVRVRDVAWMHITESSRPRLHVRLWHDAVTRTPRLYVAPFASLLGFASWQVGNGALAWCAIDVVKQVEPEYAMAQLLSHALAAGFAPHNWTNPMTITEALEALR